MPRRQQDQIGVVVPHIQKGLGHRGPLIRRAKAGGQQPFTPLVLRPVLGRGHIGKIIGAQRCAEQISPGHCRKARARREAGHIDCPGVVDKFIFQAVGIGRGEIQEVVINPIEHHFKPGQVVGLVKAGVHPLNRAFGRSSGAESLEGGHVAQGATDEGHLRP